MSLSRPSDINPTEALARAFGTATLSELRRCYAPELPLEAALQLQAIISQAQKATPEDIDVFVDDINSMLEMHGLRILMPDGSLAKLEARNNKGGSSSLRTRVTSGGSRGCSAFQSIEIKLVRLQSRNRPSRGWTVLDDCRP